MKTKSILQSKTFYLNLLAILMVFLPMAREWLETNATAGVMVLGLLNLIVRLMTDKGISVWESGPGAGKNLPGWAVLAAGSFAVFPSLPSCTPGTQAALKEVPLQACYIGQHGERICYSTKEGVLVEVDRRSGK